MRDSGYVENTLANELPAQHTEAAEAVPETPGDGAVAASYDAAELGAPELEAPEVVPEGTEPIAAVPAQGLQVHIETNHNGSPIPELTDQTSVARVVGQTGLAAETTTEPSEAAAEPAAATTTGSDTAGMAMDIGEDGLVIDGREAFTAWASDTEDGGGDGEIAHTDEAAGPENGDLAAPDGGAETRAGDGGHDGSDLPPAIPGEAGGDGGEVERNRVRGMAITAATSTFNNSTRLLRQGPPTDDRLAAYRTGANLAVAAAQDYDLPTAQRYVEALAAGSDQTIPKQEAFVGALTGADSLGDNAAQRARNALLELESVAAQNISGTIVPTVETASEDYPLLTAAVKACEDLGLPEEAEVLIDTHGAHDQDKWLLSHDHFARLLARGEPGGRVGLDDLIEDFTDTGPDELSDRFILDHALDALNTPGLTETQYLSVVERYLNVLVRVDRDFSRRPLGAAESYIPKASDELFRTSSVAEAILSRPEDLNALLTRPAFALSLDASLQRQLNNIIELEGDDRQTQEAIYIYTNIHARIQAFTKEDPDMLIQVIDGVVNDARIHMRDNLRLAEGAVLPRPEADELAHRAQQAISDAAVQFAKSDTQAGAESAQHLIAYLVDQQMQTYEMSWNAAPSSEQTERLAPSDDVLQFHTDAAYPLYRSARLLHPAAGESLDVDELIGISASLAGRLRLPDVTPQNIGELQPASRAIYWRQLVRIVERVAEDRPDAMARIVNIIRPSLEIAHRLDVEAEKRQNPPEGYASDVRIEKVFDLLVASVQGHTNYEAVRETIEHTNMAPILKAQYLSALALRLSDLAVPLEPEAE